MYKSPLRRLLVQLNKLQAKWVNDGEVSRRQYRSYAQYLAHQKAKLSHLDLTTYDRKFREALRGRLLTIEESFAGRSVLCLAARIGTECKAFADVGAFSVGVDLNPGKDNKYVVSGDFHALQFADNCVDFVYTNSLDHAFNLSLVLQEVVRVLKPTGLLIVEVVTGSDDQRPTNPGPYESTWWKKNDEVLGLLVQQGFVLKSRRNFSYPWPGDLMVLSRPTVS